MLAQMLMGTLSVTDFFALAFTAKTIFLALRARNRNQGFCVVLQAQLPSQCMTSRKSSTLAYPSMKRGERFTNRTELQKGIMGQYFKSILEMLKQPLWYYGGIIKSLNILLQGGKAGKLYKIGTGDRTTVASLQHILFLF